MKNGVDMIFIMFNDGYNMRIFLMLKNNILYILYLGIDVLIKMSMNSFNYLRLFLMFKLVIFGIDIL